MHSRNGYEDPLGFTKQTSTMLVGLGAGDLIPQCKKRNISTQALMELNKEDLIALGADESLANDTLKQLRRASENYSRRNLSTEPKTNQLMKILVLGNQQLHLIETFLAYARLRLAEKPDDFVINSKKNIRASEALRVATEYTIAEIEELERNCGQLFAELSDENQESKKKLTALMTITGIGVMAGFLYTLRYTLITAGRA